MCSIGSPTLSQPINFLARVLLVAALLAGWQAALVHPLQHADDSGLVHLGGKRSDKSAACDALAALAACAPQPSFALELPLPGLEGPVWFHIERRIAQPPPFFAQGPPTAPL